MKPLNLNDPSIICWKLINAARQKRKAQRIELHDYNKCRRVIRRAARHGSHHTLVNVSAQSYNQYNNVFKSLIAQGCKVEKEFEDSYLFVELGYYIDITW